MDLTMPVMGGGEALARMNELRPDIPIVISSGYGEIAVRAQFTRGLAGVLRKPFTMAELQDKIAAVLAPGEPAGNAKILGASGF
jgi:CheY-like chemotaxis protein